jgi:hypothetical protein
MAESFQIYPLTNGQKVGLKIDVSLMALVQAYARSESDVYQNQARHEFLLSSIYLITIRFNHTVSNPGVFRCLLPISYTDYSTAFDLSIPGSPSVDETKFERLADNLADYISVSPVPQTGTLLSELRGVNISRIPSIFSSYALSKIVGGPPGFATLYFVPPISNLERLTPTAYSAYPSNEEYPWPDVLVDIDFIPISASGHTSKRKMRTGATLDSPVLVELFQGDHLPFPESFIEHTEPCPREVYWNISGDSGKLKCLHKKVTIPGFRPGIAGITYKATNFEDWGEFVLRCRQEFIDGAYHVTRETIRPAYLPDPVEI